MSRPTTPPDNLFLRCYANLRRRSLTLAGALPLMVLGPMLLMLILLLWLGKFQLSQDIAQQADRAGSALARQISASVAEPLAAEDRLSLNMLLAQWAQNPMIAHVSLYSPSNRLLAEAGSEPSRQLRAPGQGRYPAAVHLQDQLAGQVQLTLSAAPFAQPAQQLLERLIWGLVLIGGLGGLLAWHRGRELSRQLSALAEWDTSPNYPAPGYRRRDELGELSRAMLAHRGLLPEPEPEPVPAPLAEPAYINVADSATAADPSPDTAAVDETPTETPNAAAANPSDSDSAETEQDPQDEAAPSEAVTDATADEEPAPSLARQAMLAVRLGNQEALRRLPRERLMTLLERYRQQVQRACQLYGGEQHTLFDGTSVLLFRDNPEAGGAELKHGLCCGELLRVLGHDLQIEIADTGTALHLQLALGHAAGLAGLDEKALGEHPACQQVLEQLQHSRNLLLVHAELAASEPLRQCASTRRLASQPGTFCIERLLEPYQSLLERQLSSLYNQRQA
ncbi:histidine kinase [Halopseudomonas maritima]|uniref:histidine kinase n=1 Tax=Halopseudomonas maritima TaxID=2918528 RepID=UPI001EECC3F8|nr:histidine kinase [Halopseudomonas maritima]UJJ30835.1 histidine kinase [Halopseudomonas maritima]